MYAFCDIFTLAKKHDVIIKFNDIEIKNMKELPKVVAGTPVGKSVPLVILRNGKELTFDVTLGELELAEKENLIGQSSFLHINYY